MAARQALQPLQGGVARLLVEVGDCGCGLRCWASAEITIALWIAVSFVRWVFDAGSLAVYGVDAADVFAAAKKRGHSGAVAHDIKSTGCMPLSWFAPMCRV